MLKLKFKNIKWCTGNDSHRFFVSKYGKPICYPSKNYQQLKKDFKEQFEKIKSRWFTRGGKLKQFKAIQRLEYIHLSVKFIKKVKIDEKNWTPAWFNTTPDVDNVCKTLFDLLKDNDIIEDDRFIVNLNIEKIQKESKTPHERYHYDVELVFCPEKFKKNYKELLDN